MILTLVFIIVYYLTGLLLASWVYRDAQKLDMNAEIWLIIVVITGPFGCGFYFLVREFKRQVTKELEDLEF